MKMRPSRIPLGVVGLTILGALTTAPVRATDGYVATDMGEIVQGDRGAPKTWRLDPRDFMGMVEARVGQLTTPFQPLLDSGPYTKQVEAVTTIDEGEDVEEDLQDDEGEDSLQQSTEDGN